MSVVWQDLPVLSEIVESCLDVLFLVHYHFPFLTRLTKKTEGERKGGGGGGRGGRKGGGVR